MTCTFDYRCKWRYSREKLDAGHYWGIRVNLLPSVMFPLGEILSGCQLDVIQDERKSEAFLSLQV